MKNHTSNSAGIPAFLRTATDTQNSNVMKNPIQAQDIAELSAIARKNDAQCRRAEKATAMRNKSVNTSRLTKAEPFTLADVSAIIAEQEAARIAERNTLTRLRPEVVDAIKVAGLPDAKGRHAGVDTQLVKNAKGTLVPYKGEQYDAGANVHYSPGSTANPLHDTAQRVYEKKTYTRGNVIRKVTRFKSASGHVFTKEVHEAAWVTQRGAEEKPREEFSSASFASAVSELAWNVVGKRMRSEKRKVVASCPHEYVIEAESAIGLELATRINKFPTLASDLLPRFACGALPDTTNRALRIAAMRAIDAREYRMSRDNLANASDVAEFLGGNAETDTETLVRAAHAKCDALATRIRIKGTESAYKARDAKKFLVMVEQVRAYLLAGIGNVVTDDDGNEYVSHEYKVPSAGLTAKTVSKVTARGIVFATTEQGTEKEHNGAPIGKGIQQTVTEEKETVRARQGTRNGKASTGDVNELSRSALYFRIRRLHTFLAT